VKTLSLLSLALLSAVACSSAPLETTGASASAVTSPTTTYLLPRGDDVREACHATWTNAWCNANDARATGQACVAAFLASGGRLACADSGAECFEVLTEDTPCSADGPIYPTAASCQAPVPRTCAFYSACLEADDPCGASGYALGYGEKYCSRYDVDDTFSPEGIVWRNAVLHCLQEALVPVLGSSSMTCDAITTFAFDSHPACYTATPSICFLPLSDVANVVSVIDGQDLLSLRSGKQMATVAATCAEQLAGALFGLSARQDARRSVELTERLRFWQDLRAAHEDAASAR
jgi:hypothetical protein